MSTEAGERTRSYGSLTLKGYGPSGRGRTRDVVHSCRVT